MNTLRHLGRRAEALLCTVLVLHAQFWIGGCGRTPLALPDAGYIALHPDDPLAIALADSGFAGATGVVIDEVAGQIRVIYPEATRNLTIEFSEADDSFTVTRVQASTEVDAVTIDLDAELHVTAITTSSGYTWERPAAWAGLPSDAAVLDAYEAANAELLHLARILDGESFAPATSGAAGGDLGDSGASRDPVKTGQSAFGSLYTVFGLLTSIFVLHVAYEGAMRFVFGLMSAATQMLHSHLGFSPPASYASGEGVLSIAVGDVDGDGDLDLVTANYTARNLAVLRNHGNGTFADAVLYDAGGLPRAVALADVDGDGDADILVGDGGVSVLLNQGGGTFAASAAVAGLSGPADCLALTNLSGPEKRDLAVSGFAALSGVFGQIVATGVNTGGGGYHQAARFAVGGTVESGSESRGAQLLAAGDFNGDGIGDAAVAGFAAGEVLIVLHQSDGTALATTTYPLGATPQSLAAADLDGDGDVDLAVVTRYDIVSNGSGLSILRNQGGGAFAVEDRPRLGRSGSAVTAADLSGRGGEDLIIASNDLRWGKNSVGILRNHGDATFGRERWITIGDQPSYAVAAADFDGDGDIDLVVSNSPNIVILLNKSHR